MGNYVLETILVFAGFFLISISSSRGFSAVVAAPSGYVTRRPRWRFVAYPVVALLFMGAAALIIQALVIFAALHFSYD